MLKGIYLVGVKLVSSTGKGGKSIAFHQTIHACGYEQESFALLKICITHGMCNSSKERRKEVTAKEVLSGHPIQSHLQFS